MAPISKRRELPLVDSRLNAKHRIGQVAVESLGFFLRAKFELSDVDRR